jgi:anhydro-N-acetylmuramic acid kinase
MSMYIGLMSGTSLDGVDGVLVDFGATSGTGSTLHVAAHRHVPFADDLRQTLLGLNSRGDDELHRSALAGNALARVYATVVGQLLQAGVQPASAVRALGAHGQTVRHQPLAFDGTGYTLQLLNGALLAELCAIDVVCDFRSRDLAAGGQGAPLAPAFHATHFAKPGQSVAVLNLGGIGNLTLLPAHGQALGFDCGPGNALLDAWCQQHCGEAYDDNGSWAATGTVNSALLSAMCAEPFLAQPPPKSTGRDLFNARWLKSMLSKAGVGLLPVDVQATLAELTVVACADALRAHGPQTLQLLVCGGGAFNAHLMRRLAAHLPAVAVQSTATLGVPPDQVEALAFAALARSFIEREPGNLPSVTGAQGARLLGALYPA